MSRQRITLKIDRVSVPDGVTVSGRALAAEIEAQLAAQIDRVGAAALIRGGGAVAVLDGGRATRGEGGPGLEMGIGQAIAQATAGVLKR